MHTSICRMQRLDYEHVLPSNNTFIFNEEEIAGRKRSVWLSVDDGIWCELKTKRCVKNSKHWITVVKVYCDD